MVGGYDWVLVTRSDVTPEMVRSFYGHVREAEMRVDDDWGARPVKERFDRDEVNGRIIFRGWFDPNLLRLLDEARIDAIFGAESAEHQEIEIYESEKMGELLEPSQGVREEYVARCCANDPERYFEGQYVAPLEFARDHEECGIRMAF